MSRSILFLFVLFIFFSLNPLTLYILFSDLFSTKKLIYLLVIDLFLLLFLLFIFKTKLNNKSFNLLAFSIFFTFFIGNLIGNIILNSSGLASNLSSNAFEPNERDYMKNILECYHENKGKTYYKKLYFFNHREIDCNNYSSQKFENGFIIRNTKQNYILDQNTPVKQIWFFGGSTAMSSLTADDKTIPSILAKYLFERGKSYKILNFGASGLDLSYEISNLVTLLRETKYQPDTIIFYDGYNDSITSVMYSGDHVNIRLRIGVPIYFEGFYSFFYYLSEWISEKSKIYEKIIWSTIKYRYYAPRLEIKSDFTITDAAENYSQALNIGKKFTSSLGIKTYFFLQPMAFTKSNPIGKEVTHYNSYLGNLGREVYSLIRLNEKNNKDFYDISDVFDKSKKEIFFDHGHVGAVGNTIIANKIGEILLERD